jgi:hypothetical protein
MERLGWDISFAALSPLADLYVSIPKYTDIRKRSGGLFFYEHETANRWSSIIGVAHTGAWSYAFTYELFQRWFPEVPERALHIKRSEACRTLVSRYLDNVVAADRRMIAKVFHILKWTPAELDRGITALLEQGSIREIEIEGIEGPQLVSARVLDGTS